MNNVVGVMVELQREQRIESISCTTFNIDTVHCSLDAQYTYNKKWIMKMFRYILLVSMANLLPPRCLSLISLLFGFIVVAIYVSILSV